MEQSRRRRKAPVVLGKLKETGGFWGRGKDFRIDLIIHFVSCLTIFCPAFLILAALVPPILAWRSTYPPCRPSVFFIRRGSPGQTERKLLTYNICKNCTADKNHMPPARRVFDPDFKFLELFVSSSRTIWGRGFCWRLHLVSLDPHAKPWSTTTA